MTNNCLFLHHVVFNCRIIVIINKINQGAMSGKVESLVEIDDYNVRVIGPQIIKKGLKEAQNSRFQKTGVETPLMEIAKEWLVEKAATVLSKAS